MFCSVSLSQVFAVYIMKRTQYLGICQLERRKWNGTLILRSTSIGCDDVIRCEFESFAAAWIKYSFFCDTTRCFRWQRLKCPIRKKILDRWNDYALWNRWDPNTSDAVAYPKRTNISCLRILSKNEFYALKLQVLLSEKYFEPIIFIDARTSVKSTSALLSQCLWTKLFAWLWLVLHAYAASVRNVCSQ